MTVRIIALLATAALVVGGLAGVRDTGDTPATVAASPAEYCELSAQLEQAGAAAFRRLEQNPRASRQDFERAQQAFVREHGGELEQLRAAAPAEIQAEVELLVTAALARGGLAQPPDASEAAAAENVVAQFESENCRS